MKNDMTLHFIPKLSNRVRSQYTLFCLFFIALVQVSSVYAAEKMKTIPLSVLGDFSKTFSTVKKVNVVHGQRVIGEVNHMPGENFSVAFPFDVQHVSYIKKSGSVVDKGEKVANVEGYDVHHFIDEYQSAKTILAVQEAHYKINKKYFDNKTIKNSEWIEITKSYFDAKLSFEHIKHQMSFLSISDNEQISLISPQKGILKIPNLANNKLAGELAFEVIAQSAIKIKVTVPLSIISNLSHFEASSSCKLAISSLDNIADKFHQTLWVTPTSPSCSLMLGQLIHVTPVNQFNGYKIEKSAVFEFEGNNYIAVMEGQSLTLVRVELRDSQSGYYTFSASEIIDAKQVLTSSVSILQGYLLNLGAE
jgi:hypothetical protein